MSMRILIIFSTLLPLWILGATFTQGPEATLQGGKITVSFTVSAATDVEVAIVDTPGNIIRHLAAGVLGGIYNPPGPLVPGLSQSLEWDGKDDYGNWAVNGPYRVRVRLGVVPQYQRSISTRNVLPGTRDYGPGGVDPRETYLSKSHPLFTHDSTLYEDETVLDMTVDDNTDRVYFKLSRNVNDGSSKSVGWAYLARFNGLTGDLIDIINSFDISNVSCQNIQWGDPVLSWDGQYIYYSEGSFNIAYCPNPSDPVGNIIRFTADGAQAPWPQTGLNYVSGFYNGDQHTRGHTAGPDGSLYIMAYAGDETTKCPNCTLGVEPSGAATKYAYPYGVSRVKDGQVVEVNKVLIYAPVNCLKVDLKGNIYISARIKPLDKPLPDFVEADSLQGEPWTLYSQAYWADEMYGSIVKFDSTGGQLTVFDSAGALLANKGLRGDFEGGAGRVLQEPYQMRSGDGVRAAGGFQWAHYGMSHILTHTSWRSKCFCNLARFDVDRYGRVFYPNTFQHEFSAIDNSRNEIFRLKNRDIPAVAIGLGHQIEVTDRNMYVADFYNNQIVVFGLSAEAEEMVNLPLSVENGMDLANTGKALASYPNPFNPATRIIFHVQEQWRGKTEVKIFDVNNRLVRTLFSAQAKPGLYSMIWDGTDNNRKRAASGIFVCRLKCGNVVKTRKLLMAR